MRRDPTTLGRVIWMICHDQRMDASVVGPSLIPELLVSDTPRSLDFYSGLCGFQVDYERPEEGFACISLGSACLMLEQHGVGRNWVTGPLERPLGRGVNFQISVPGLHPILTALSDESYALFMPPETTWYRIDDHTEVGVDQFLVADPDGYLIRFQAPIGRRIVPSRGPRLSGR